MPNWCSCDLRINGKVDVISNLLKKVGTAESVLEANLIIPYPQKFFDQDKKAEAARAKGNFEVKDGFNSGGYEWCCKNWGTKWGFCDCTKVKWFKKSAAISFDTAWSPPLPLILKLSKMAPDLTFTLRYYEQGMAFKGVYQVKGGEVLCDTQSAYHGNRGG